MWTPGRVAAAFATANGDPNKIQKELTRSVAEQQIFTLSALGFDPATFRLLAQCSNP